MIKENPNNSGIYRVYGKFGIYGSTEKARIWKAWTKDGSKILKPDTILIIKDASGNMDEVFAGEDGLIFDNIQTKH